LKPAAIGVKGDECSQSPVAAVSFHGSCPLCRLEIGHDRRCKSSAALDFVDVAQDGAMPGFYLDHQGAVEPSKPWGFADPCAGLLQARSQQARLSAAMRQTLSQVVLMYIYS
jgi:hypothetical protein